MPANTQPGEFDLIARYFHRAKPLRHAALGVGDDCALLQPPPGHMLAISTDTLLAGCHFFADVDAAALGHKALAVNLSDLAASGAQPLAFVLALTLPAAHADWLAAFARGLHALADAHGCELIGGDTTRGPLAITVTVLGSVPQGQAVLRSGARVGDDIYVSHPAGQGLGDARLALHLLQAQRALQDPHAWHGQAAHAAHAATAPLAPAQRASLLQATRQRLETPTPRIALGLALRGVASSCMDLSDGLQGDMRHILAASGVGAVLHAQPFADDAEAGEACGGSAKHAAAHSGLLAACSPAVLALGAEHALQYALAGGDDYELLFTAPVQQRMRIAQIASQLGLQLTRIGRIEQEPGLRLQQVDGSRMCIQANGFDHFAA